jgi:hypothetical protein
MLKKTLEDLCAFGDRSTTTEKERQAAEYLKASLEKLGYSANLEEFKSPSTFSWTYLAVYLGFAVSIPLSLYAPLASIIIFSVTLVLFLGEQTTLFALLTTRVFALGKSQNVIGRPAAQTGADKGRAEKTIWLVAHYDTSKTSLAFSPASVPLLRPLFFFSLILIAGAFFTIFFCYHTGLAQKLPVKIFWWFCGAYFFYMAVMMLERELRGKPVQGAADNASGAAIVMELAKRFAAKDLKTTDLRVLFTGAEEVEMVGMFDFIKKHAGEISRTGDYFLNFDSIGDGSLCWITKEGMIRPLAASKRLTKLCEELSQLEKFRAISGRPYTALTLDTLVARSRGYEVLSFMALEERGFPAPWHWFDDTLERVDLKKLALAADFAEALVDKFDRDAQ